MSCFTDAINFRIGTFFNSICLLLSSIGVLLVTLIDLCQAFSSDDRCRELLERLRWPSGPTCPRCPNPNPARLVNSTKLLYCKECDYQFTVTSNTIFHDSHLPLIKWLTAVYLMCEGKKGMSALQLKRTLWEKNKGSYKTAWYLCHRIRAAMATAEKPMLDGTVEIDETYVGGKVKPGSIRNHKRMNPRTKEVVIGIRQRNGELRFIHAKDAKAKTVREIIGDHVSEDVEVLVTGESTIYPYALTADQKAKHKTINHSREYVVGDVHTNTVESSFSLLKRGIIGSWHRISAKHLPAYLEEMTFRFNRRNRSDLFMDTLRHMVTADPLTFEALTADEA